MNTHEQPERTRPGRRMDVEIPMLVSMRLAAWSEIRRLTVKQVLAEALDKAVPTFDELEAMALAS